MNTMTRFAMGFFVAISALGLSANAQVRKGDVGECRICHTENGHYGNRFAPRLEGQLEKYFISEMKAYRSHSRFGDSAKTYMWGFAEENSDADFVKMAKWFAAAKPGAGIPGDPELIKRGQDIYQNGIPGRVDSCADCHGVNAEGSGGMPRLAGQFAGYLNSQMAEYIKGTVKEAKFMPDIAVQLTESETAAVSEYLQSMD